VVNELGSISFTLRGRGVIGNPNLSKAGRSSALLIPPSTTKLAPRTPPFKVCDDYPARREISSAMLRKNLLTRTS
jgi:hypothetical protein